MGLFSYNLIQSGVILIYEVYIDVYFIKNVVMDMFVLTAAMLLLKCRVVIWRILTASVLGGLFAVAVLCLGVKYGLVYVLGVIVTDLTMSLISIGVKAPLKDRLDTISMCVIYIQGLSFACSKLGECLYRFTGGEASGAWAVFIMSAAVAAMLLYAHRAQKMMLYDVVIYQGGESISVKALYDSGNGAVEPLSGRPVSVLEENETLKRWIREYDYRFRAIPYKSIGNENGILEGMVVDELVILGRNKQAVVRQAVIALYDGKLSNNGRFQMILNQSLI
jgi:sigma-E processing peptidase SpoIIGA